MNTILYNLRQVLSTFFQYFAPLKQGLLTALVMHGQSLLGNLDDYIDKD